MLATATAPAPQLLVALGVFVVFVAAAAWTGSLALRALFGVGGLLAGLTVVAMCLGSFVAQPGVDRRATMQTLQILTSAASPAQRTSQLCARRSLMP